MAETCQEGLQYIAVRLEEGCFEEMIYLFEDVVHGFCKIQDSLFYSNSLQICDQLNQLTLEIEVAMHQMITAYENSNINDGGYILNYRLIPNFHLWRYELSNQFKSYLFS